MTPPRGGPFDLHLPRSAPVVFTRAWLAEGYAKHQVDTFVGQVVEDLESPNPSMRPGDVHAVRFGSVRMRGGYDMREVDAYLDEVEQYMVQREEDPLCLASYPPPVAGRRPDPVQVWVARLKWALLLCVVVLWVYADVFSRT